MIEIKTSQMRASAKGPAEWFSGAVRLDPLVDVADPGRVNVANVTFEPGAHTAWHTHPLGQTLVVHAGCGIVQAEGQPAQIIRPGDVIWTPPGIKHWHGALPNTAMTHMSIVEKLNGKAIDWMEHVTAEQYATGCAQCAG